MTYLSPVPKLQFLDANGNPLAGGKLYSYAAGTTTPQATYTDSTGSTPNANPVILDSRGEASVWLSGSAYKLKLTNSLNEEIWTVDQVAGNVTFAALAASGGSSYIGFLQSGTGAVARTTQSKLREFVSVKDFGAVGDGVTDDWAAFKAAHDSLSPSNSYVGGTIYIPSGTYYLSQTWAITKRVTIVGTNAGDQPQTSACKLTFPANTDGIRFYSNIDSSTGTDATQSVLKHVEVIALAKNTTGVGIKSTTQIAIEYCIVRDFKSHGIEFHGQTGAGATGIADFWKVSNVRIVTCGGHGLYNHGNDSQLGVASQVECIENGGWGFYNDSPYTNTYIACQAAGNTSGAYFYSNAMTYQGGIYIGCYAEAGPGDNCSLTEGCLVLGGTIKYQSAMAVVNDSPGGCGINVPTGGRWMGWRNGTEVWRIDTNNVFSGLYGIQVSSGVNDYVNATGNVISQKTSVSSSDDRMRFDNPNGRVGSIVTSGTSTSYNTSSDYRLKENVLPMTGALKKIKALNPVTYIWKTDGAYGQGFIAHELQAVVPDCVSGKKDAVDDEGKPIYQGVDVSFLVATIVKAIQEQQEQIDALRSEVSK